MNKSIKSAIVACVIFIVVSTPSSAEAETFVFSGKDSFGEIYGNNADGNLYLNVSFFESKIRNKSDRTDTTAAYFYGNYYTESECWSGWGFAENIQFKADGSLPKRATASGAISVTWIEYCTGLYTEFIETVTFNGDLTAMSDQTSDNWGTSHNEFGSVKVHSNFNYSSTPATVNAGSISSPTFGTVTPGFGYVGRSRGHTVQIIR